jgi:hypothetical protein
VSGTNFEIGALGLGADYVPTGGSAVIDAGEAPGASDHCTATLGLTGLGSRDRTGTTRGGDTCDAGAFEVG